MNSPSPLPTNGNGSSFRAGNAAAFGTCVATAWIITQHMHGVDYPAGYESAIAGIITTIFVYARAILEKFTGVKVP
jgi:hypothetical protein